MKSPLDRNLLIQDLQRVDKQLGQIPSIREYDLLGNYHSTTFKRHFGSWEKALTEIFHISPKEKGGSVILACMYCEKPVKRRNSQRKKTIHGRIFCSSQCSGTYNALHKTIGTRRSKLEVYLEEQLTKKYPNLEIHYNRKDAINSELDIYVPSLRLAFELNGIFHYEPIFGEEKLSSIQNNDDRKFQACLEKGIELCIMDVSQIKGTFKPSKANKILDIIFSCLFPKTPAGFEPDKSILQTDREPIASKAEKESNQD